MQTPPSGHSLLSLSLSLSLPPRLDPIKACLTCLLSLADAVHPEGTPWVLTRLDPSRWLFSSPFSPLILTWKPLCLQQLCSWRAELSSMHGTKTMQIFLCFFFNFYWSVVGLQCFVSFQCTPKWISYIYTNTHSFLDSFPVSVITECWVPFPVLYSCLS